MSEYLKENDIQVNQEAKKVLNNPDPSLLYCLQAADLAVTMGLLKLTPALLENLEYMLALWSPEGAMEFIAGEHDLVRDFPKKPTLQEVANAVLQQLGSRLSAELEGHPRPRDLPANLRQMI